MNLSDVSYFFFFIFVSCPHLGFNLTASKGVDVRWFILGREPIFGSRKHVGWTHELVASCRDPTEAHALSHLSQRRT